MLSFLREQNYEGLPAQKASAATATKAGGGSEDGQEQEYLTVATHEGRVRRSTTLLAVLFVIGLVCLWFMIKKSVPQAAEAQSQAEEAKIELAIRRLTGVKSEMFNRMDEIVNKFYEFSQVMQINVDELVKNPFELELFLASLGVRDGVEEKAVTIDVEAIRRRRAKEAAKELQLLSIMQSAQGNCCMINDKILYEADSIGDFKVQQIGDNFVKLQWVPKDDSGHLGALGEKVEIELKLSE